MAAHTTFDEPPEFDVGDRVVAAKPIGPRWHRTTRGESGIVVARTADRLIAVRFDDGHVEHVHPSTLTLTPRRAAVVTGRLLTTAWLVAARGRAQCEDVQMRSVPAPPRCSGP